MFNFFYKIIYILNILETRKENIQLFDNPTYIYKIISRDTKMMKLQADLKSERNKNQRCASKALAGVLTWL